MTDFVHLHLHTQYSLLDGAAKISEVIRKAKDLGQTALAITDHGVMYGAIEFYKAAKAEGIRPIIGCEVYTAARTRFDKQFQFDGESGHLILLAKNNVGYSNLIYMVSKACTEGMYYKPRVDMELLREHSEGIIALSACLAGDIQRMLLRDNYNGAKEKALEYAEIFRDGFYLELQNHGLKEDAAVITGLAKLSQETGIPLVATNDVHYIEKEDARLQNVLMCIQTNKVVGEPGALSFETDEFYLKSGDEMAELFSAYPEAIQNTVKIANECDVTFDFDHYHLPSFPMPDGCSPKQMLRGLAYDGLKKRYPDCWQQHSQRLNYELETIEKMGYVDYFLIVHDFISYAKTHDIPVGPGRGSAAGSLVSYCLSITEIDPIQFDLLFERFLNPERVSMPDIDVDFCVKKRGQVIDYVVSKYGVENVSQIITFGTMAARLAVRDVARALGLPYSLADRVAKLIPFQIGITIDGALLRSKELKELYQSDMQVRDLIDMARKIEGFPRHASTHAAGVVITGRPIYEYVPIQLNDNNVITQFPMTTLEELGLLKMDFLGLRNLTVIHETERMIREHNPEFSVAAINIDDPAVYKMLAKGDTQGVFQLESEGIRQVLRRMQPKNIEDIIAVLSLYRPGPMDSIPRYINNKNMPDQVRYEDPRLKKILGVTYGCIVYQEQVMQIVRELAGYSYGRADLVRRAMAKKKMDVMKKEREIFINGQTDENGNVLIDGCKRRGVSTEVAERLFDDMTEFAKYAFNKSHAACYAFVAYQTAYLKHYYPAQFMAAMMTSVSDNIDKISGYIDECKKLGIRVIPPLINKGKSYFAAEDNYIYFALSAIKNVGKKLIEAIEQERTLHGSFTSIVDFFKRMDGKELYKKAVESLIKAGAFDEFGYSRKHLMTVYEGLMDAVHSEAERGAYGQMDLFGDVFKDEQNSYDRYFADPIDEFPRDQKLMMEREVTGVYMSGHPLAGYDAFYNNMGYVRIADLRKNADAIDPNKRYRLLGIVSGCKSRVTKTKRAMAFAILEDESSSAEMIIFPQAFDRAESNLSDGSMVCVEAKINVEANDIKIICEHVTDARIQVVHDIRHKLYLIIPSKDSEEYRKVVALINQNKGSTTCVLCFQDTGQKIATKKSFGVNVSDSLLKTLEKVLGKDHAILS